MHILLLSIYLYWFDKYNNIDCLKNLIVNTFTYVITLCNISVLPNVEKENWYIKSN